MSTRLICFLIFVFLCGNANAGPKERAYKHFEAERYDLAIKQYRKHLRRRSSDYQAWNLLAASYYHIGQPKKALKIFRRVFSFTMRKSFNLFYQGLCYQDLKITIPAKKAFQFAAKSRDEYAQKATFQIAVMEYHERNEVLTRYWLKNYLKRFPMGRYKKRAFMMLRSLNTDTYLPHIKGAHHSDLVDTLIKFHPLSLFKGFPHFWILRAGYDYDAFTEMEPSLAENALKQKQHDEYTLHGVATLGVGPFKEKKTKVHGGYRYHQKWLTDTERFSNWVDDFTDFEYFAFRPDLLERYHKFFGHITTDFSPSFSFSLLASYEKAYVGSGLLGNDNLQKVLAIGDSFFFKPSLKLFTGDPYYLKASLLLNQVLNKEESAASYRSYSFFSGEIDGSVSVLQSFYLPDANLEFLLDIYHYSYVYNDYFLDHARNGGSFEMIYKPIPELTFALSAGAHISDYRQQTIRVGDCKAAVSNIVDRSETQFCSRSDEGRTLKASFSWNISRFHSLTGHYIQTSITNSKLEVYNRSQDTIAIEYTTAFPGVSVLEKLIWPLGTHWKFKEGVE